MPNFNDEDRDSSTDDDWDKSSSDEEEKKPVQVGKFFFGQFFLSCFKSWLNAKHMSSKGKIRTYLLVKRSS